MGVSRWLFALLLCQATLTTPTDVRFLRHSGRREGFADSMGPGGGGGGGGGGPPQPSLGVPLNASANPADLLFEDEPDPRLDIEERLVVRGTEVVLECIVPEDAKVVEGDDSVEGEVRWYHDGALVEGDLRVSIMWTGRLVMSHAVSADSGLWWCRRSGRPAPKLRLIVTIPPERPYLKYGGAQLAAGARLTTREGNSITLHCVVEGGNPAPSITWILGGEDITASSQIHSQWEDSEGVFNTKSNLTVARVGKDLHNNTVACVVRHPSLPVAVSVPLRLNIEYSPDFRLRRWPSWGTPVREGASVSLLCSVDANPPSDPTWVKETEGGTTEVASSEGWLNLTRVTGEDRAWYKCATVHTFGHFASHSVFINVLPAGELLVSPPREVEVGLGEAVQIPCTNPASRVPTAVCWTKILQGGRAAGVSSQNSLLLRKTTYSDGGRYRCVASDATKTIESDDVDVIVTGAPMVAAVNSTVLSIAGRPTALSAHVCGRPLPLTLTWLPPPHIQPINPGDTKDRVTAHNLTTSETPGCHYAVLTIAGVKPHDEGNWVIVGVNDRGATAALIRLNVTAAAHSVAASSGARAQIPSHLPTPRLTLFVSVSVVSYATTTAILGRAWVWL
ncbi:CD166 antigen homolog isoform X2 [Macrobrachium rosenbergii]|uniref:CD166 antigen homolog isoform X2 n=1 Tax=Macrobrachium rosenbergii TaxID=79674 RepID=UPI0034D4C103